VVAQQGGDKVGGAEAAGRREGRKRLGLSVSALAATVLLWQTMARVIDGTEAFSSLAPAGSLGATYFVTTLLGHYLARRSRETQQLATQQSVDLAQLSRLNQLIVARMRTGIVIVDAEDNCHVMNDAAWYLMGMPPNRVGELVELAPEVLDNLRHWQTSGRHRNEALTLANGVPAVVPRFARLSAHDESETLIFLEDSSIVSRRAQELTLSSLGRLSATIAHEIRNPLAAISHSAQLLAESDALITEDERLTSIILRHCRRMNDIIENVLQLARQEPPRPEAVRLRDWLKTFAFELKRDHEVGNHRIIVDAPDGDLIALIDPSQLEQVMWNLCQNAFRYGHQPDEAAEVTLAALASDTLGSPVIEVRDRGPGIAEEHRMRIFEPFYTSASDGNGLGLYLCQQICASNQAILEYDQGPQAQGGVFRISMQRPLTTDLET
ncbi:MAG: ATP-binding protein, partial [Pseudomonadota bacterium]